MDFDNLIAKRDPIKKGKKKKSDFGLQCGLSV